MSAGARGYRPKRVSRDPAADVISFEKASYFWSGKEAHVYWEEASGVGIDIPTVERFRRVRGAALRELKNQTKAIRRLVETAKRELTRYAEAVEASPSQKERLVGRDWYTDKIGHCDRWLSELDKLPTGKEPPAEVISLAEVRSTRPAVQRRLGMTGSRRDAVGRLPRFGGE